MNTMHDLALQYDTLSAQLAQQKGISKTNFYRFVKENNYERITPGLYMKQDAWIDELAILHHRCPKGVFSHDEAFYYHGLSDREPLTHTLTVYTGYGISRLVQSGYKIYTVKKELLDIGKISVENNYGNIIPIYDLERSICDLIRSRNTIEIQEFSSVLKTYISRKDKNLNKLMDYAKLFKIDNVIRTYMEVLL